MRPDVIRTKKAKRLAKAAQLENSKTQQETLVVRTVPPERRPTWYRMRGIPTARLAKAVALDTTNQMLDKFTVTLAVQCTSSVRQAGVQENIRTRRARRLAKRAGWQKRPTLPLLLPVRIVGLVCLAELPTSAPAVTAQLEHFKT